MVIFLSATLIAIVAIALARRRDHQGIGGASSIGVTTNTAR
jgi:hypothetical protein